MFKFKWDIGSFARIWNRWKLTLLDVQERVTVTTLNTRFIAATPEKTLHGKSVIGAGFEVGLRGWVAACGAFAYRMIAVRTRDSAADIIRIARIRI